jgi:hypothetical protein
LRLLFDHPTIDHTYVMKKYFAAVAVFAIAVFSAATPAWSANKASDAILMSRQTAAIPKLQELAARAGGYPSANVRVSTAAHQITITAIGIGASSETKSAREIQAAQMISAVENAIAGQDAFGQVMTIHVNYVGRSGKNAPIIQGFDFFKSPTGAFVLHKT